MGDLFYGEQALGRKEVSDAAEMYKLAALRNEPQVPASAHALTSRKCSYLITEKSEVIICGKDKLTHTLIYLCLFVLNSFSKLLYLFVYLFINKHVYILTSFIYPNRSIFFLF